jgi:hypothetical protein
MIVLTTQAGRVLPGRVSTALAALASRPFLMAFRRPHAEAYWYPLDGKTTGRDVRELRKEGYSVECVKVTNDEAFAQGARCGHLEGRDRAGS